MLGHSIAMLRHSIATFGHSDRDAWAIDRDAWAIGPVVWAIDRELPRTGSDQRHADQSVIPALDRGLNTGCEWVAPIIPHVEVS
jgi:hypothetical protein